METVLLVLHLLIAIFLVGIILLQNSSGNALSGLGGGTSASSFLSARGKGNLLTKITTVLAVAFFVSSISLSIYYRNPEHKAKSILEQPSATTDSSVPLVPVAGE
ncbi:MAG: preprotein translocase subunit SecG [Lactobacillaceae bacterium]|jgi:preprotein translocase subunit SecG|nr:preprotein translocase subunit SecG [Lactobacillaceae bacterium]